MVPALRPTTPLSSGPTKFLALSPIWWQVLQTLNVTSPAAASPSAEATRAEAIKEKAEIATSGIRFTSFLQAIGCRAVATPQERRGAPERKARAGRVETKAMLPCQGDHVAMPLTGDPL